MSKEPSGKKKAEMSSLSLHFLVEELKHIEGSRVDKIYQPEQKKIVISIHIAGSGRKFLVLSAPKSAYLIDHKDETAENPSGFAMLLRKHIEGARLKHIRQHKFERILVLEFERKTAEGNLEFFVIAELFSKGNIVFTDSSYKVMGLSEEQVWSDRKTQRTEIYVFPSKKYDPLEILELPAREAFEIFSEKNMGEISAEKFIATQLSFGGENAKEICRQAEIDSKSSSLSENEAMRVISTLKSFLQNKKDASYNDLAKLSDSAGSSNVSDAKLKKLEKMLEMQKEKIVQLEQSIDENSKKGDAVYANYKGISQFIDAIREMRKNNSWQEIEKNLSSEKRILKVDPKTGKITLEI